MSADATERLSDVLAEHELELPADQVALLEAYCQALWDWNSKLNLTRHVDYRTFVGRDLWDTHHLANLCEPGQKILDWGSGGGVPGLVLAILRPDIKMELCESVGKKATALRDIVQRLGLKIPVHAMRLETILERPQARYDAVCARAIGPLWKMLRAIQPFWPRVGQLYVIKGPRWVEERGEARHRGLMHGLQIRRAAVYKTPGEGWESVVLRICPSAAED